MSRLNLCKTLTQSHFWNLGFARTLGVSQGRILSASRESGLVARVVVPPEAHLPGEPLSCGVLTALADEWTSQCFVLQDQKARAGVTVALSLNIHNENSIGLGSPFLIRAHASKTGRSLGFCDFTIIDEATDSVIATGQHTKYLPMGTMYNLMVTPWLFPLISKTQLRPISSDTLAFVPTVQDLFTPGTPPLQYLLRIVHSVCVACHADSIYLLHACHSSPKAPL